MEEKDIVHLARLARVELSPEEIGKLGVDIADIVEYVSVISSLTAEEGINTKVCGPRYNVFRSDTVTTQPKEYTDRMLAAAPQTQDGYVVVKKIIDQNST